MRVTKFQMARLGGSRERADFQSTPPLGSNMLGGDATPDTADEVLVARHAASLSVSAARAVATVGGRGKRDGGAESIGGGRGRGGGRRRWKERGRWARTCWGGPGGGGERVRCGALRVLSPE